MSQAFRFPLVASIAGHVCVVALLIILVGRLPPAPLPIPPKSIEVILAPQPVASAPPVAPKPPPQAAPKPPPQAELPPPPPRQAMPETPPPPQPEPPPPQVAAPAPRPLPPPPPKVVLRPPPPPHRPPPAPREPPPEPPVAAYRPPPPPVAPVPVAPVARVAPPAPRAASAPPVQNAAVPRPTPPPPAPAGPVISAGYRSALSAWLESHKHYPETARARGEEGRAMLRFRVDRSGRVLRYAVVQGTGYADLDAAIDQMMRGAVMPPFPADMTASDIEVSVTVRFALSR